MAHLQVSKVIPASRFEVYDFLTDVRKLPFLLAPTIEVEPRGSDVDLKRGSEVCVNMTRMGLSQNIRWRIEDVLRGSRLTYRQVEGVFSAWSHTMKFEERGEKETLVTDLVDYQVPFGLFGYLADDLVLKMDMRRLMERRLAKAQEHFGGAS